MATAQTAAPLWLKGKVKAVPSGDSLVIMAMSKAEIPPEKTITLSSLIAPRLARRGGIDEPFAWKSREFLRKLCIGKEVIFKVEYTVPSSRREFGSVFLDQQNVASLVVERGWAKVREPNQQKKEADPFLVDLLRLEEQAREKELGLWGKENHSESSLRNLLPSDLSKFNAMDFKEANKGKPFKAIIEHVRDGSTVRAYLLPGFQFVQVFVAGIQAPSMGRRTVVETGSQPEVAKTDVQAKQSTASLDTSATSIYVAPDFFAREAKHFTEIRVLHRDVRIVIEGVDKFNNLVGSIVYADGDTTKDLGLELVKNGLAKYVQWSAETMEDDAKMKLKAAELEAKKDRHKMWVNYVPPPSGSKAIVDQNFTGKVIEVVSGDCIIVEDNTAVNGSTNSERRVNFSSIKCPKMGNRRKGDKPEEPFAREAKEFLRKRLIGQQVKVSMEYSRKLKDESNPSAESNSAAYRVMDFGSVFIAPPSSKNDAEESTWINIAEELVARGFATVVRHREFEERSKYYDSLLAAESRALRGKKGLHSLNHEASTVDDTKNKGKKDSKSKKEAPITHIADLTAVSGKKVRDFLPFLQKRRHTAVVEYVFSGHRFKLFLPKETCNIAFSFSGVRCPARGKPFSDEAIAFMRGRVMQRDVEIEVEAIDRSGTFLGSMWESKTNVALPLLQSGLAKLQSFVPDRTPDSHLLTQAEQSGKEKKLKIWENYVEGQEQAANGFANNSKQKEELKVVVTEVLDEGQFFIQTVEDQKTFASIQQQLASLNLSEAPLIGSFNPAKGDIVLAQFNRDESWNRAMIVKAPKGAVESPDDEFEVVYIDFGNQEVVPYSSLRPIDSSISSQPGLVQLCRLAYIKVPNLEDEYGWEAAEYLTKCTIDSSSEFRAVIEDKETTGGKAKEKDAGTVLVVDLFDAEAESSINAAMLKEGYAKLEKKKRWDSRERKSAFAKLEECQEQARKERKGIWQYGDCPSDDEEVVVPTGKPARGRAK